jgi:phage-related protein
VPRTEVVFFAEADGRAPVQEWLCELRRRDLRAHAKCEARIRRLEALGHELRRPEADFLRGGLYELRTRSGHVNYRILYFFHGRNAAVLVHALTKEGALPEADVDRARQRMLRFGTNPRQHLKED